jgi:hypothetical protein
MRGAVVLHQFLPEAWRFQSGNWKIQQAFGDNAMGAMQIKEWFNRFKDGRTLADSDQRSWRTVREIADEIGISTGSAHSTVTEDLHMCRVVAKFVPKLLSQEQQQLHLEVTRDMLECANGDPEFLKTVTTGDERWVYGYDLETKVQWTQWKHSSSPRPKKHNACRAKSRCSCFL